TEVGLFGSERFPRLNDVPKGKSGHLPNQYMDMVRQDRPGKQFVSFAVENRSAFSTVADDRIAQGTASEPTVNDGFDSVMQVRVVRSNLSSSKTARGSESASRNVMN